MTDTTPSAPLRVRVARGEMNAPWSDSSGQSYAAGGPLLEAFVAGIVGLERARRVLVAGPHTPGVLASVRAVCPRADVTVLVRSVGDAEVLSIADTDIDVVAGALDGFLESTPEPFDAVLALDGVDRLQGYDSADHSWSDTVRSLFGLAAPDAVVAIAHPFDTAPANLLDARPASRRFDDDEMRPLHNDPTRPAGALDFFLPLQAFTDLELTQAYSAFGPHGAPRMLVDAIEFGSPQAFAPYAIRATRARRGPLLAAPDEMVRVLSRGDRLDAAADAGIAVFGAQAPGFMRVSPAGVLTVGRRHGDTVQVERAEVTRTPWPDDAAAEVTQSDTAQPSETAKYLPIQTAPTRDLDHCVIPDAALVPSSVSIAANVADRFVRLAELGDVPSFRELAHAVGRFVDGRPVAERRAFTFDNIVAEADSFSFGLDALKWNRTVSTAESLAAAFWLLQDRMRRDDLRHPWPDHLGGQSLVALWLGMAGHDEGSDDAAVAGRQLADALALGGAFPTGDIPDLRTALADAATARRELGDAQGQIFGLERTIGFRDKQLRTREEVIRGLRGKGGAAAAVAGAPSVGKMVKRAAEVRSFGELSAGVDRVIKRAKRNRAMK